MDATLDPATLALYPLRTRPLAVGLLAASATGAWPLANVVGLLGVTVGLARGAAGLAAAVVAVVLEVLFCITMARFVTTSMARLLSSRRGKDFAVLLVIPIFALYEAFAQVVPRLTAEGKLSAASFGGVDAWLRWLPPGLAAHAIQDASSGHPGAALARLAVLAAVIVVLGWLWVRALHSALVTADASTQSSAVRGAGLPFARYGLRGTLTARFLLYQRREPLSVTYWAMTVVIMAAVSVSTITTPAYLVAVLGSAGFAGAFIAIFHANSIGLTGPGFGLEAMALTGRRALRAYFSGQNIALGLVAVPLLAVVSFGIASVARHPVDGFLGLAVDLAAIGAGLAVSNILTAGLAYPVEKRAGNPAPRPADGYSGYPPLGALACIVSVAVAITPVVLVSLLHQVRSGGDPHATTRAGRRRVRIRAGLGRDAIRRRHGRAEAARTLPGRAPQQALAGSGAGRPTSLTMPQAPGAGSRASAWVASWRSSARKARRSASESRPASTCRSAACSRRSRSASRARPTAVATMRRARRSAGSGWRSMRPAPSRSSSR